MFGVQADTKCISLKYSRHLASQYGIELEQLQMAAFRCVIQQEYIRQVAESACFPFSFVIKYAAQQRSPEVSKMAFVFQI